MLFNHIELHTDCFETTTRTDAKISSDEDTNNEKQNCVKLCEVTEIKGNDENKEIITGSSVTKKDKNGTNQDEKSKKELDNKYFRFNFINLGKYIFLEFNSCRIDISVLHIIIYLYICPDMCTLTLIDVKSFLLFD